MGSMTEYMDCPNCGWPIAVQEGVVVYDDELLEACGCTTESDT